MARMENMAKMGSLVQKERLVLLARKGGRVTAVNLRCKCISMH